MLCFKISFFNLLDKVFQNSWPLLPNSRECVSSVDIIDIIDKCVCGGQPVYSVVPSRLSPSPRLYMDTSHRTITQLTDDPYQTHLAFNTKMCYTGRSSFHIALETLYLITFQIFLAESLMHLRLRTVSIRWPSNLVILHNSWSLIMMVFAVY